jgi:PKD repeat protein
MWNTTGSNNWTVPANVTLIDYLVIAGGGNGGGFNGPGGGGGAGGLLNGYNFSVSGNISLNVGAGGAGARGTYGGLSGSNTTFSNLTAIGGGGAGGFSTAALAGGSGGGAGGYTATYNPANGTSGQGNRGGINSAGGLYSGGGGGGSGQPGYNYTGSASGSGGNGTLLSFTGTATYYAGGGGGSATSQGSQRGLGGAGGGGAGGAQYNFGGIAGDPNTGGGGGGSHTAAGGAGGSGVVIIRYLIPDIIYPYFTVTPLVAYKTKNVTFTGSFSSVYQHTIDTWSWDFGDNTTSSDQNPVHAYQRNGNFSVNLTVHNSTYGDAFILKTDYIFVTPSNPDYDITVGNYTVLVWNKTTNTGNWLSLQDVFSFDYLIVGAGGSGGRGYMNSYASGHGGGGGAGGYIYNTSVSVTPGIYYPITIGRGILDSNGDNSFFFGRVAYGGGRGGAGWQDMDLQGLPGEAGGSGGGGGSGSLTKGGGQGGSNVSGQGSRGDNGGYGFGGAGGGYSGAENYTYNNITGINFTYATGGLNIDNCAFPVGSGGGSSGSITSCFPSPGSNGTVIIRFKTPAPIIASFTPLGMVGGYSLVSVQFTDTSISNPYDAISWSWSYIGYGDNTSSGVFSTVQNPLTAFTDGNFLISLNATTIKGSNVSTQTTWINVSKLNSNPSAIITNGLCQAYIYDPNPDGSTPATFIVPPIETVTSMKYLIIGGGGNGGASYQPDYQTPGYGGGGGAGGFIYNSSFSAPTGMLFTVVAGMFHQNSSLYNTSFGNILAYRGGNGGSGFPDTQQDGEPGENGSSGGGGGSGGTLSPWGCIAAGGANITGQGFYGGCGYGGYALTTGGGGGGAGSEGLSGQYGSNGGNGLYNDITFSNLSYSEGGYGESISGGYFPCKTTRGSGGRADYSPYSGTCRQGQNGTVVIQVCYVGTRPISIEQLDSPKPVQFRVQSTTGKEIVNAGVSIQGISTTTGVWDWLFTLLGIPLGEAPIQSTYMNGTTDSYGDIEFLMIPTVKYNITTVAEGYTFPLYYIVPHDSEYTIVANNNETYFGWTITDPVDNGTKSMTVTSNKISDVLGQITVKYNDTGLTTTGGFINMTEGSTLYFSIPALNSINETRDFVIPKEGVSVKVSANITSTIGEYKRYFAVTFNGQPVTVGGLPSDVIMWVAFGLMMLTTLLAGVKEARHVAIVICLEAWSFLSFGWFQPLVDKNGIIMIIGLFLLATVITILWNLREGMLEELSDV